MNATALTPDQEKILPTPLLNGRLGGGALIFVFMGAWISAAGAALSLPQSRSPRLAHAIDDASPITAPHEYAVDKNFANQPTGSFAQSIAALSGDSAAARLQEIARLIQAGQLAEAQAGFVQLQSKPLNIAQRREMQFRQAQLAYALGQYAHAIEWLRRIHPSANSATTSAINANLHPPAASGMQILRLLADSQQALGRRNDALPTLLRLDALLAPTERLAHQRRILALLNSLDSLSRSLLREKLLRENTVMATLNGWLTLSDIARLATPQQRRHALRQWRAHYPDHPATTALLLASEPLSRRQHIAMLLPITSPFGKSAQAFYDGFLAARERDLSAAQPTVSLMDIGEAPALAPLYARTAVQGGADFIVGPLGRKAVNALLSGARPRLPTLVLGNIPAHHSAPNLYGISLSPEPEARQAADRAFADGHRKASVFHSDSEWGQRVATAFAQRWEVLGGVVVDQRSFPRRISDYSQIIQELLGLKDSLAREQNLAAQLQLELEFTPRRRDDLDFLFLAAQAEQARLVAPQLRFFQAHDLPLYATSHVYSGAPNPATDADLNGVLFGDMDWMIEAAAWSQPTRSAPAERAASQYYHTGLDRLYALGLESYRLIPLLPTLREQPWRRYLGNAVHVSVQADGNAVRHLAWARFERGLPVPVAPISNPVGAPQQ